MVFTTEVSDFYAIVSGIAAFIFMKTQHLKFYSKLS